MKVYGESREIATSRADRIVANRREVVRILDLAERFTTGPFCPRVSLRIDHLVQLDEQLLDAVARAVLLRAA